MSADLSHSLAGFVRESRPDGLELIPRSLERVIDRWVEVGEYPFAHDSENLRIRKGGLVRALRAERVINVAHGDDASFEWDLFSVEAAWVAASVPTFVMGTRYGGGHVHERIWCCGLIFKKLRAPVCQRS